MGSAFNREIVRSIVQSAGRFIAIAVISLLGAGFYAGLRMAPPDMRIAGDEFFDATNLYDISVITTFGLDDESVEMLAGVEGVGAVMPAYRADAMVRVGENGFAASIESLPVDAARASDTSDGVHAVSDDEGHLNRPILIEGSWPADGGAAECVVGADAAASLGIALGDELVIEKVANSDSGLEGLGGFSGLAGSTGSADVEDTFAHSRLTVVGLVRSGAYASSSMLGTTSLGTGSIELYAYVPDGVFADDLPYSVAYLTVLAARAPIWESGDYDEAVDVVKQRVQAMAPAIADARLQAVMGDLHLEFAGVLHDLSTSLQWADELEKPDVFVLDRSKNPGVAALASDAEGIAQIATFLPFMFFLVAALVSLTSMTRMVDEERLAIGTHKALGYGKARITSKYLIFGALASGVGSAIGIVLLGKLLPWFILTSYHVTYSIPVTPLPIDPPIALRALGLSVGITVLATWWAAAASLRERPAALMLPRVPKAGKRIILEHITPLWKRMSFSQKVTARNLLRYKRRFFMAVIGVAGCTALLMIGFGLRDAIGGIVSNQYETLMGYDMAVRVDKKISGDNRAELERALAANGAESHLFVGDFNMIAKGSADDMRIEVVVPSDVEELSDYVTLRDRETGEPLSIGDDAIVLTEKAARVLGVQVGDSVGLYDENKVGDATGDPRIFTVGGIAENYLGHYAYMSSGSYAAVFGKKPTFDLAFVKLSAEAPEADALSERLLSLDGVNTVSSISDKIVTYQDMLDIMNKLIYVVVMLSAALAFVVLYNLTNINISERVREIATLKVLGFTRGETNAYIFREVMVMALIGALVGCVIGVPLAFYIAEAAETANMMFGRIIEPFSYVASFALTMLFAVIVAFTMRGKLARVNMVESLKSVE